MPGDSSTTWLTPPRRGPCLLSWWTSSESCGRTVEFKPALTELQSSSSMTRHLSKTLRRRWDHVQKKSHSALSSRQWALQIHKLNLSLWRHLPVPTSLNSFTMIPFGLGSTRHNIQGALLSSPWLYLKRQTKERWSDTKRQSTLQSWFQKDKGQSYQPPTVQYQKWAPAACLQSPCLRPVT